MKRLLTLIVLLGLTMGTLLTGCGEKPADTGAGVNTNAPTAPSTPPAPTNAPAK